MKKIFEYIGLISFTLFSFYYTNKVVSLAESKDPLMNKIEEYANKNNRECVNGYISDEGIVLGVNGLVVDNKKSYSNMRGYGFNEDLVVFKSLMCNINGNNYYNKYILKGNESKNAVSFLINVNDLTYIKDIVSISLEKDINLSFILSGSTLETYKDYFYKLYQKGYSLVYGGSNKIDLDKFISIMNSFNKDNIFYCIKNNNFNVVDICKKENINSINTKYIYSSDILYNTKYNLDKGNIYVFNENKDLVNELSSTYNYVRAKGIDVIDINKLLEM